MDFEKLANDVAIRVLEKLAFSVKNFGGTPTKIYGEADKLNKAFSVAGEIPKWSPESLKKNLGAYEIVAGRKVLKQKPAVSTVAEDMSKMQPVSTEQIAKQDFTKKPAV